MNNINITVYFVGNTPEEAATRSYWDEWKEAEDYRLDEGLEQAHVYVGTATIAVEDLEVVTD